MTKEKEALKLALEALEDLGMKHFESTGEVLYKDTFTAIKEALAQSEQDNTYIYASNLAKTIWQKHYMKESPKFALFDTTEGVLTQIDNMTCGLVREKPAQSEQEPVAVWELFEDGWDSVADQEWMETLPVGTKLYTTPPPCPTCEALARTVMMDQTGRDA